MQGGKEESGIEIAAECKIFPQVRSERQSKPADNLSDTRGEVFCIPTKGIRRVKSSENKY